MRKMTMGRALGMALVVIAVTAGTAQAAVPADRYGFAHGCFSLQDQSGQLIAPASGPFRMQATDPRRVPPLRRSPRLPRRPGDRYSDTCRGAQHGSGMGGDRQPERRLLAEEQSHEQRHPGHFPLGRQAAPSIPRPRPARTVGTLARSAKHGPVYGLADAHMHWTGFRLFGSAWHCGRPWHKYGIAYAMPDCAQYDQGTNGEVRAFIDGRVPGQPYDTVGWPTFGYWPGPTRQAEEGTYYTSVERAWLGGLRLLVVLFVDNEALCDAMTVRDPAPPAFCNDMDSVRQQNQDLEDFEDYIDAQNGGPGKGWLRIVTSPAQARKVIDQGKLAVVKGIELSRILNCGETVESDPEPQCDRGAASTPVSTSSRTWASRRSSRCTSSTTPSAAPRWTPARSGRSSTPATSTRRSISGTSTSAAGSGEDRDAADACRSAINVAAAHLRPRPAPADDERPDLRPAAALQPARPDGHRRST